MQLNLSGALQAHDPTVIKEKGCYYRIQTGNGIPLFKSKDLIHWEEYGSIFKAPPEWIKRTVPDARENDFWAPDCVYRNGKFRLYYSVSSFGKNTSAIGMCELSTLDIRSTDFSIKDYGPVICSSVDSDFNAIDPQVCCDEMKNDYLVFGSFWAGIHIVKLNESGFIENGVKPVCIASRKCVPNSIEGGYIYRRKNKFFLFVSHDFCCRGLNSSYKIVAGVSDNIEGPYVDFDGKAMLEGGGCILRDGNSFERWAGPGHNSIFEDDDGKVYLVYHAYDRNNAGKSVLQIEEIEWINDLPDV